ncbi:hypothetical protein C8J57DRAFT_1471316, partial [Mycena rebaudengoi]
MIMHRPSPRTCLQLAFRVTLSITLISSQSPLALFAPGYQSRYFRNTMPDSNILLIHSFVCGLRGVKGHVHCTMAWCKFSLILSANSLSLRTTPLFRSSLT